MPQVAVAATAEDTVINTKIGFSKIFLINPAAAAVNLIFHQGAAGTPDPDGGILEPGQAIVLNFSRPVFLNTPANAGSTVQYTALA